MKAAALGVIAMAVISCSSSSSAAQLPQTSPKPSVLFIDSGLGSPPGSDPYDSADFTTVGDWKVAWTFDCTTVTDGHDWLILAVYRWQPTHAKADLFESITPLPSPEPQVGVTMESQEDGKQTKGTFFIRVLTECRWTLRVLRLV